MVRTVHTNDFYEISLQISDPKIEFSMKAHFFENDNVQNVGKCFLGKEKKPAGCPDSKTKVVNIFRNIPDPNYI